MLLNGAVVVSCAESCNAGGGLLRRMGVDGALT